MTKERRLAIQMWEFIVEHMGEEYVPTLKESFCEEHKLHWQHGCWFCEYCRRDFRHSHPGREGIDSTANNCDCCPLYKYEISRDNYPTADDACGCASEAWRFQPLFAKVLFENDKEAAKIILKLLRGEK